jgi:choice-of-anchor C domain-containing protein
MFNLKSSAAGALVLALAGGANASALVADGTFTEGVNAGSYSTIGTNGTIGGAWTVTGGSVDLIGSYWAQPTGSYSIDLDGNSPGTISQSLNLAAGDYTLGFWMAGNPDGGDATKSVQVTVGGSVETFTFSTTGHNTGDMGYTFETLAFSTPGATTLTFQSLDASGPYGAAIGGVSVTAVPEPASMSLLLAGLGMVGVMASRRRSR